MDRHKPESPENTGSDIQLPSYAYHGEYNLENIVHYIKTIHVALNGTINAYKGERDIRRSQEDFTNHIIRNLRIEHERTMERLHSGEIYELLATTMLKKRLSDEMGERYQSGLLKVDASIQLEPDAISMIGVESSPQATRITFSPEGVTSLSKTAKEVGLTHEVAHLALGHTGLSKDRRQVNFDADYVGALLHGNVQDVIDLMVFSLQSSKQYASEGALDMEGYLEKERQTLYRSAGSVRGANKAFDARVDKQIGKKADYVSRAVDLLYPSMEERIEEMEALRRQLAYQDKLLELSPHYRVKGKVDERVRQELHDGRVDQAVKARRSGRAKDLSK